MSKGEAVNATEVSRLYELDATHWMHSQGNLGGPPESIRQRVFESGQGVTLVDVEGRTYIDAMAGLWNVNVGYGRQVLAQAAADQMTSLAYTSGYNASGNVPAINLAARLAELAPGDLNVTFFASGGGEANDTAYKLARLYGRLRGEPQRVNIVSRLRDYHGLTWAATSATGIAAFHKDFGPLAPGFLHAPAPDPYHFQPAAGDTTSAGVAYAEAVGRMIESAGPETVAAVIAEPVQGAGGVIVPPAQYFPRLREICDRYGILLIADEVITGFGRTGRWFAMEHWGVGPDLMIFAKGVTSGYLPLSGVMLTSRVYEVMKSYGGALPHGFTYSGHATACAVALRNLDLIEDERLVERAATTGHYLLERLESLKKHSIVGDVRGLGLLAGIELVADSDSKSAFDPALGVARQVALAALDEGLIVRPLTGDVIALSPPLVISEAEVDAAVSILDSVLSQVGNEF
jgi:putrescine---pyruvate transaminase